MTIGSFKVFIVCLDDLDTPPTTFDDPMGRWCPKCGEPDEWAAENDGLTAIDPATIRIDYATMLDSEGIVYKDRRLSLRK